MEVKSKFKFWIVLIAGLLILISSLLYYVTYKIIERPLRDINISVVVFYLIFCFSWIWLVFGELRTKAVKVKIGRGEICVRNFLGLGTRKIYRLEDFNGFETSILPSRYDEYEFLYLIVEGKRVIKLSEYYHDNYLELKAHIADHIEFTGQKKWSLFRELKEIFI
jgi:hypothetical protein